MDAGGALAAATNAWARLNEWERMMFFAALVRDLMSKPASQGEVTFWIATLQDWQAALFADLVATRAD
jgi:hypothetical protein